MFVELKKIFALVGLLGCFAFVSVAIPPWANIPEQSKKVVIDGKISPGEWDDAAVIKRIYYKKQRVPASPATDFYVKYGKDALYVAAVCHEPDLKYPEAYKRKWNDLLFRNDDAVQVVIGLKDKNVAVGEKINMGGYDGAMDGKSAKADFYYCYTVNAAGNKQRTFNETNLENSMFNSAVKVNRGKNWVAEIEIPYKSCGLKNPSGKIILANLFRFRPPVMTGWYYPNFGGYSAMPFGVWKLLASNNQKSKTVESPAAKPSPSAKKCYASVQYSPLCGVIAGKAVVSGNGWGKLYGILNISGMPVIKQELKLVASINHDSVPEYHKPRETAVLCKISPGDQPARKVSFEIVDSKEKVLSKASGSYKSVKAPEWLGTENGKEYVDKKFPAPWTLPVVKGDSVTLLNKTVKFNNFCLPSSIRYGSNQDEMIAADPYIQVKVAGRYLKFNGSKVKSRQKGNSCINDSTLRAGNILLKMKSRIEPDGFTVVKFMLDNISSAAVQRVSLRIPIKTSDAKFIMPGQLVQNIGNLSQAGYRGSAGYFWVGTYDKGLAFSFDTPLFFSKDLRHQVEVTRDEQNKSITWLTFNFCDGPNQINKDTVFRFFLHPTPTKPQVSRYISNTVQWKWERWGRWHGYPDIEKIPELKKWVAKMKEKNRLPMLYTCQGLQENAPYFKQFRSDLELQPRWRYYRNKGVNCYATSKRGPEGDLQLWGWKKLIDEAGIRGTISDGLSVSWGDYNPAHWQYDNVNIPVEWDGFISSRIVAQRNFLKRLCGLMTDTGEPYCNVAHTGGAIDINTLSFMDGYLEGEQMARFKNGYFIPPAIFAIGYSGLPWGIRTIFWAKRWRNYHGCDKSLAYTMLFNSELTNHNDLEPKDYAINLLDNFPPGKSSFIPFWKTNSHIKVNTNRALSSMYLNEKTEKAMIVVSNLSNHADNYKIELTDLFPGKTLTVKELLSDRKLDAHDLKGSIEPHSCDLIMVSVNSETNRSSGSKEKPLVETKGMNRSAWKVNTQHKEVETRYPLTVDGTTDLMSISSLPKRRMAVAEMKAFAPKGNATVKLIIVPQIRFNIYWGQINLCHDHGWFIRQSGQKLTDHIADRFMELGYNKPHELLMTVRDGKFYAWYDSRVVVSGFPVDHKNKVEPLRISTWHDNVLRFKTELLSNRASSGPVAKDFDIKGFHREDWIVNTSLDYIHADYNYKTTGGKVGLEFFSSPGKPQPAIATLKPCFGRNLYVDMMIKLPIRFRFRIGNSFFIGYGGGWTGYGWLLKGVIGKRGNGRVIREVPIVNKFVPLKISIRDGVMDMVYNNMVVIEKLPIDLPEYGNTFKIETWWKDKIAFSVNKVSTKPETIVENEIKHPIIK